MQINKTRILKFESLRIDQYQIFFVAASESVLQTPFIVWYAILYQILINHCIYAGYGSSRYKYISSRNTSFTKRLCHELLELLDRCFQELLDASFRYAR